MPESKARGLFCMPGARGLVCGLAGRGLLSMPEAPGKERKKIGRRDLRGGMLGRSVVVDGWEWKMGNLEVKNMSPVVLVIDIRRDLI